eukprot:3482037-Amphidinium_carterae.1
MKASCRDSKAIDADVNCASCCVNALGQRYGEVLHCQTSELVPNSTTNMVDDVHTVIVLYTKQLPQPVSKNCMPEKAQDPIKDHSPKATYFGRHTVNVLNHAVGCCFGTQNCCSTMLVSLHSPSGQPKLAAYHLPAVVPLVPEMLSPSMHNQTGFCQ